MAGCARAEFTPANPIAHLSFSFGASAAVIAVLRGVREASVRRACAPPVPSRLRDPLPAVPPAPPHSGRRLALAPRCRPVSGEKTCDRTSLCLGQLRSLPEHVARRQRREHRLGRNRRQHIARGRARTGRRRLMAGRARLLVDRGAVRGLCEHRAAKDHATNTQIATNAVRTSCLRTKRIKSRSRAPRRMTDYMCVWRRRLASSDSGPWDHRWSDDSCSLATR